MQGGAKLHDAVGCPVGEACREYEKALSAEYPSATAFPLIDGNLRLQLQPSITLGCIKYRNKHM